MKKAGLGSRWYAARFFISFCIALGIALVGFSLYRLYASVRSPNESVIPGDIDRLGELPPPPELERAIEAINDRLSQSKILNEGVRIEDRAPSARFTIVPDHPNFYFQTKDYTVETGGNVREIPTAGICKLINKIEQEENSNVLEALDKIDIEAELGATGAGLKANGPLRRYLDIWFALQQVGKLPKRRAEILLKGYADGQQAEWDEELKPKPYRFEQVPVLFPVAAELDSLNPVTFSGTQKILRIPARYSNEHLPDLRAAFFKQDFIAPFLDDCWSVGAVEVFIIKGYEFKDRDPRERRVDVQVNLF